VASARGMHAHDDLSGKPGCILTVTCTDNMLADAWWLLRQSRTAEGLKRLEIAIDCPYVSAKSLQALNQAYILMHATSHQGVFYMQVLSRPEGSAWCLSADSCTAGMRPLPMLIHVMCQDWARILAKANRTGEACDMYEQLAGMGLTGERRSGNQAQFAEQMADQCLSAIGQQQGAGWMLLPCT
jgi:hypothetical protein